MRQGLGALPNEPASLFFDDAFGLLGEGLHRVAPALLSERSSEFRPGQ